MNLRTIYPVNFLSMVGVSIGAAVVAIITGTGWADAQEFTRSTIPLKSGGSMTSIQSQGRNVAYLNEAAGVRTADARNAAFSNTGQRRETGFNPAFAQGSNSFYRQAAQGNASDGSGSNGGTYPYPGFANSPDRGGFSSSSTSGGFGQINADGGQANLRFDRFGNGDRPSGSLGETGGESGGESGGDLGTVAATNASFNRVAQLPQPPTQLPSAAGNTGAGLPPINPTGCNNCGPNYVNPAANYAVGYQGFQPGVQAANAVPALNIQNPLANSLGNPGFNPNCCPPQGAAGFGGFPGYQFQQGIGTPQFGQLGNNNPWWSSFLTGSGQYTPLLQFRNMPPGTYLGQGLIGQPTAYVDGQPFRNLLRYVSP